MEGRKQLDSYSHKSGCTYLVLVIKVLKFLLIKSQRFEKLKKSGHEVTKIGLKDVKICKTKPFLFFFQMVQVKSFVFGPFYYINFFKKTLRAKLCILCIVSGFRNRSKSDLL